MKINQNLEKIEQNLGKIDQNLGKSLSKGPKNMKILSLKRSIFDFRLGHTCHLANLVPPGWWLNLITTKQIRNKFSIWSRKYRIGALKDYSREEINDDDSFAYEDVETDVMNIEMLMESIR